MKNDLKRFYFFEKKAGLSLLVPACVMVFLWFFQGGVELSEDELLLWRRVRAGQEHILSWRKDSRLDSLYPQYNFKALDPWETGFIGVEWSPVTTTLGSLEAKRTAADPLWTVFALREFCSLGLARGDGIVLLSSSSFPGLVFSILAAAEHLGLDIVWIHSLGASTWGANMPELLWPKIGSLLRKGGFMSSKPDWYTLGGREEAGLDMSVEGREILLTSALDDTVPLLCAEGLDEMIVLKSDIVRVAKPLLVVTVGGSHSTFGGGEASLPGGGLYLRADIEKLDVGEGVFRNILDLNIPVLHFLDMRRLASYAGIPYDGRPVSRFMGRVGNLSSAVGLIFYIIFLITFRRWRRGD